MYESILVPIEMGQIERSQMMLGAARQLLAKGGKITCLSVLPEIPGYVAASLPEGLGEKLAKDANAALSGAIQEAGIDAAIDIRIGHPAHTILDVAKEIGAGLIVVGSHKPGLEDYLLGSTASRVVRHATCHVLVQR